MFLPIFAVAYVYEDLPRHDRVERLEQEKMLRYYDKGVMVYEEVIYDYLISRRPILDLKFVSSISKEDAYQQFMDTFQHHIIAISVALVPSKL